MNTGTAFSISDDRRTLDAPYRRGPSKVWLKSKNLASEAVRREREEEWRKLKSHYNIAKPITVVMTEIADEVAISFAHSQYDTTHIPILPRRIIRRVGM